ncbi:hypothetical protein VZ95_08005 [Elstera litoralis]|uniref:Uncharacterized protein n=1 Tax=Elstera litoralis TaxID=552518 RepID=A0A0F3ITM1_9PROT|nr:hypothetical protein [Elstera litoralis]KJV09977.1 hypothetical protein VZ95_08005 [Elstera litoralis]
MTNPSGPDTLADLLSRAAPVPSPEQTAALESRILHAADRVSIRRAPRIWLVPTAALAASLFLGLATGYALVPAQTPAASASPLMLLTLGPADIFSSWFNFL